MQLLACEYSSNNSKPHCNQQSSSLHASLVPCTAALPCRDGQVLIHLHQCCGVLYWSTQGVDLVEAVNSTL